MNPRILAGILWLISVFAVIISIVIVIVFDFSLLDPEVETTLRKVAQNPAAHIIELLFDILSGLALLAAAAPLYVVFSKYNKALSLIGSYLFVGGGIIIAVHDMENLALTWVADAFVQADAVEATTLVLIGQSMILTGKWGVSIFTVFIMLGVIIYSYLLVANQLSKLVGGLGIIAGVFGLIGVFPPLIDPSLEVIGFLLFLPYLIWQFVFGGYLLWSKSLDSVPSSAGMNEVTL